jgi:GNAT superfamily N-acetyltransferase
MPGQHFSWQLRVATLEDIPGAISALSDGLDEGRRAGFRDKLTRFASGPDRELIVAVRNVDILGLTCVTERDAPPATLPRAAIARLRAWACGSALIVHPAARRQGIGQSLQEAAERWARERKRSGYWLITHRMASWHQRHGGFHHLAPVQANGVTKHLLGKEFA